MGSHRPLFLHACASHPCVSRFGSLRYWPLNSQTCLSCCCKQTVKTNLSVLILLWISVLFEQFLTSVFLSFKGGWVGQSLTSRRLTRPPKTPLRAWDTKVSYANTKACRLPNLMKEEKGNFNIKLSAVSRPFCITSECAAEFAFFLIYTYMLLECTYRCIYNFNLVNLIC